MGAASPTYQQMLDNCRVFASSVGRGDYYIWASKVVAGAWRRGGKDGVDIRGIVSGIMILEYSWNEVFYKDGTFDKQGLERCVQKNMALIARARQGDIIAINRAELRNIIDNLFGDFLQALRNQNSGFRGPVAVAKCLHLLSPRLLPLWDTKIATATGHYWVSPVNPAQAAECYERFTLWTQRLITRLVKDFAQERGVPQTPLQAAADHFLKECHAKLGRKVESRTMLKLIDEYLYVEHTRPDLKPNP